MERFANPDIVASNPSIGIVEEAMNVWGGGWDAAAREELKDKWHPCREEQRNIGCLVSLGTGLGEEVFENWERASWYLTDAYAETMKTTALCIDAAHAEVQAMVPAGSYYRLDPVQEINGLYSEQPEAWVNVMGFDQFEWPEGTMQGPGQYMRTPVEMYMDKVRSYLEDVEVGRMCMEVAGRLRRRRVRRGGSQGSSSSSTSSSGIWSSIGLGMEKLNLTTSRFTSR
jgi:hypothetical protein